MTRRVLLGLLIVLVALSSVPYGAAYGKRRQSPLAEKIPQQQNAKRDRLPTSGDPARISSHVDTFVLAEFTFDANGQPDTEGWFGVDRTTPEGAPFHVEDFAGLGGGDFGRLTPIQGQRSLWCGQAPTTAVQFCRYATLPGYGNSWDQRFESQGFYVLGDPIVSYRIRWDSEAGYDKTRVEYRHVSGQWDDLPVNGGLGFYDGVGERVESFVIDGNDLGDTLRVRFRFASDGAWSDEDGLSDTDGAVILDSLTISDATGIRNYQDFEAEPVGAQQTNDGTWSVSIREAFGDFSGLFPGISVLQQDPCLTDISQLWGFFEGSTYLYCQYGCDNFAAAPGYAVIDQPAVPGGRYLGPGYSEFVVIDNNIWSPPFSWTEDKNGTSVPTTASDAWLEFDVYRDLRLECLLFYYWSVRAVTNGCPGSWRDYNFVYYGGQKDWRRVRFSIAALIAPGVDSIQVALGVKDMCPVWCIWAPINGCHTHAPLFDNVRVIRVDQSGPVWAVNDYALFQDNFSTDGTTTGTVRADMALDLQPSSNMNIRPGDSTAVTVSEPNHGLDYHIVMDPSSGPAVYCHIKDVGPAKSGAAISGDIQRWPVVSTGSGWTVFQFDTAYGPSAPVDDRYCVDLNDNLYTPGDVVSFYFSARDAAGRTTYWTRPAGATADEAEAQTGAMEMTCLPANALGGGTDILYVDDFDHRGAQPFFDSAFEILGITPDRFDVRAPSSAVGNGLGSRVVDIFEQITSNYQTIIWNSGDLRSATIGDGTGNPEKSDDFRVLFEFLDNRPGPAGVYISGDDLAEEWRNRSGRYAVDLKNTYMNFVLIDGDHIHAGQPISPEVVGQAGSLFDHPAGPDRLVAYGGCPGINDFDVLQPAGQSSVAAAYSNNSSHGAVLSQSTTNSAGSPARVVLSGFSYDRIRDDTPQLPMDRVEHLQDIVNWLGNLAGPPTGVPPTPKYDNRLSQNFPNPFNPTTRIRYAIRERGAVSLRVYDVAGRLVRTLVDEVQIPRAEGFVVTWDGESDTGGQVSSGVYFYKLMAKDFSETKKMVVLK
jgi:hypothetical protein